jgi:hypothetical protein
MRRISLTLLLLAACAGNPPASDTLNASRPTAADAGPPVVAPDASPPVAPDARPPAPSQITWTLEVAPASVTMAKRSSVTVRIAATNRGTAAVEPARDPLDFTIDGQDSFELNLAFGNGARGPEWESLPPGATARDARRGMQLVETPGEHVLVMSHAGVELGRATLRVTK